VANNLFWIAIQNDAPYSTIGMLGFWRGIFISSGLPLSCLYNPFIRYFGGRRFYYAVVVNLDCVLKLGFLIRALAKYRDNPAPLQPSA
jgi:hypothetical protein